uniref:Uncharacterized protein n=1 Tax=uncultured marine thaumarchaeote KM3_190_B07 TaxID=1456077 RepID=A0A075GWP3_9ARCH|nr:hypothetical protein [uncultured marine thaumarchaeote KM3_190_B07]
MSAMLEISISVCPAPTLSMIMGSNPAYSSTRILFRMDLEIAPVAPLDAMLLIYVPESVDSVIRTLSPSIAPPDMWLVGSIASTAGFIPNFFNLITVLSISDDFPAPAGPVMPITTDLPEVLNIFLINFLDSFSSFSKIEIAFAIAPRFAFFKSEVMFKYNYLLFLR